MQTTRVPRQSVSSEKVGAALEKAGWLRDVAGDADFRNASAAVSTAMLEGRGMLITGAAGCGKTALLHAIMKCMPTCDGIFMYCKDPEAISTMRNCADWLASKTLFVDDLGAEPILHEYGNIVDVVGDAIQSYHYRGTRRMFITSNLNSVQINERYGGRVFDRIMEMCVVLRLNGASKRRRVIYGAEKQDRQGA